MFRLLDAEPFRACFVGWLLLLVVHGEDVLAMSPLALAGLGGDGNCSILILTVTGMPT